MVQKRAITPPSSESGVITFFTGKKGGNRQLWHHLLPLNNALVLRRAPNRVGRDQPTALTSASAVGAKRLMRVLVF